MPFSQTDDANTLSFTGATWNEVAGVYGIMNAQKQMIYIGETDSFKRRMAEHQADTTHKMHSYDPALVWAEVINDATPRKARELLLIAEYAPLANG